MAISNSQLPISSIVNKQDFPILHTTAHGHPLVYLDNAATTQKPNVVIKAINDYYCLHNANVHRGVYHLAELATLHYERARKSVQQFINAAKTEEVVFVRGVTEAVNLIARCAEHVLIKPGDNIIVGLAEHHSNIVPWQLLCERLDVTLKVIPLLDNGELDLAAYQQLLNEKTALVAVAHVSNVLGTINPIKKMTQLAHNVNAKVLVDGAQALGHIEVDVQALNCDFYCISGHKMYAPTGIGALYGKLDLLKELPPFHGGGEMIETVSFEKTTYNQVPYKFEAGTPNIAGAIGLHVAIEYLNKIGLQRIKRHEDYLLDYCMQSLASLPKLTIYGQATNKVGIISFAIEGLHAHDLATILDRQGIAVRAGHHCAMPLMNYYQVPAMSRVSFGLYNSKQDVDQFINALKEAYRLFDVR